MIDKDTLKMAGNGGAWGMVMYFLWDMTQTLARIEAMLDWVFQLKMQGN